MNIYQRINEVRKLVDYAKKEKQVEGYKAVTHDQITGLTREHFIKHGVVIVPRRIAGGTKETGTQTSRGTPFIRMEAVYEFDFVNVDDPQDKVTAVIEAHAIDHGDKAPGKLLSYAKKYAVLKVLDIESGEEDEERQEQFRPKNKGTAIQAAHDAFDSLSPDRKNVVLDTLTQMVDYLNEGKDFDAFGVYESVVDQEEKLALWSKMSKEQKSSIKKSGEQASLPGAVGEGRRPPGMG